MPKNEMCSHPGFSLSPSLHVCIYQKATCIQKHIDTMYIHTYTYSVYIYIYKYMIIIDVGQPMPQCAAGSLGSGATTTSQVVRKPRPEVDVNNIVVPEGPVLAWAAGSRYLIIRIMILVFLLILLLLPLVFP